MLRPESTPTEPSEQEPQPRSAPVYASRHLVFVVWTVVLVAAIFLAALSFVYTHPHTPEIPQTPLVPPPNADTVGPFPSPIKFMTVLSGPYRMACTMLKGAVHNGITMHILGWGSAELGVKDFRRKEEKLKKKIPFLYNTVKDWDNSTILMFIDGGDIFWQSGPEAVYTAFKQLATEQRKIVFGSERNCWIRSLPPETCQDWPVYRGSPYRWLNSGCWIGELGSLKNLLHHVNESVEKMTFESCNKCGDQALFGKAYIAEGWNRTMQLDHFNTICQNLHSAQGDFCPHEPGKKVRNCVTKSTPALFHFNGNPRHPDLNPKVWQKKMWWNEKPVPRDSVVVVDGKLRYLDELCPKLDYDTPPRTTRQALRDVPLPGRRSKWGVPMASSLASSFLLTLISLLIVCFLYFRRGRR